MHQEVISPSGTMMRNDDGASWEDGNNVDKKRKNCQDKGVAVEEREPNIPISSGIEAKGKYK